MMKNLYLNGINFPQEFITVTGLIFFVHYKHTYFNFTIVSYLLRSNFKLSGIDNFLIELD